MTFFIYDSVNPLEKSRNDLDRTNLRSGHVSFILPGAPLPTPDLAGSMPPRIKVFFTEEDLKLEMVRDIIYRGSLFWYFI